MKYVMMLTDAGQHLPIVFPDALVHATMAMMSAAAIEVTVNSKATAISAGFVSIAGDDVTVYGESESMGGMQSNPVDAIRIMVGDSVAFMPDGALILLMEKIKQAPAADDNGFFEPNTITGSWAEDEALRKAADAQPRICDCERGHNGLGMSIRECDCQEDGK